MVTLLSFADGEPFATGAMDYLYQPATFGEDTLRILLAVEIESIPTVAMVDTGAPYVVCAPRLVRQIPLDTTSALERKTILIRGSWVSGYLYRLAVRFLAETGDSLAVDATVFLPDLEWEETWGHLPSFIGWGGCLERMRFAVDPGSDTFYFGPLL